MIRKFALFYVFLSSTCFAIEKLPYCDSLAAMNFAKKYLPEDPIILECGGCNGLDTIMMAQTWPNCKVYTFEPIPSLFQVIIKVTDSYSNISPYQLALGDFCGKGNFYVSNIDGLTSGSSSLLPPKDHLKEAPSIQFDEMIEVDVMKLDDWALTNEVQNIDYFWLDMQGYELNMLMVSELAKKAKVIYIEVEFIELYAGQYLFADVAKWMLENGFELIAIDFPEELIYKNVPFEQHGYSFGNAVFMQK